jgi:hypothetical protein
MQRSIAALWDKIQQHLHELWNGEHHPPLRYNFSDFYNFIDTFLFFVKSSPGCVQGLQHTPETLPKMARSLPPAGCVHRLRFD